MVFEVGTAGLKWELILSDDPAAIARLEKRLGGTRAEVVDDFIERSCWSDDVPHLVGHRGTPAERLRDLRAAWHFMEAGLIPTATIN